MSIARLGFVDTWDRPGREGEEESAGTKRRVRTTPDASATHEQRPGVAIETGLPQFDGTADVTALLQSQLKTTAFPEADPPRMRHTRLEQILFVSWAASARL